MEKVLLHRKVLRYSNPSLICSSLCFSSKGIEFLKYPFLLYADLHLDDSVHKSAYLGNASSGLSLFCISGSDPIVEKSSLRNYPPGLHSSRRFDSNLPRIKSSFFNSFSGTSSSFHLLNSTLKYFNTSRFNNVYRFHDRRLFSVSSSDISVHSEVGVVLDQIGWKRKGKRSYGVGMDLASKVKSSIIEIIKSGEDDMEAKLSSVSSELSVEFITEIFRVLNSQMISGLRFFRWARANNPRLFLSADFCSLIISNCGWLDDYDTMLSLLNEFRLENICLHESAFWFLPVFRSSQSSLISSVERLMEVLNQVGGSCRGSGISALIQMFCRLDLFGMAKHVLEISGKNSHYDILVRERCKKGHLASDIIQEMKEFGCTPTIKTYNYVVASLCKQDKMDEAYGILEQMQQERVLPDALTYEIFIHKFCNSGKMDLAKEFLDKMGNIKLEPRLETHTALLKALFKLEQYAEAYNYVIYSSDTYKLSGSKLYSLLADLHQRKGDLMSSQQVMLEMMNKDHKPDFTVYTTLVKKLQRIGQYHVARDLRNMFSRYIEESNSISE